MVERTAVNRDVVGSSPTRGVFLNIWLRGQAVKTSPFHGGNPGSIPGRVTICIVLAGCLMACNISYLRGAYHVSKRELPMCSSFFYYFTSLHSCPLASLMNCISLTGF